MISRYLFLLVAVIATSYDPGNSGMDSPKNGVLTLKDGELSEHPRALNGYWEFYPNELIGSAEMNTRTSRSFIEVPSWWTEEAGKANVQFATYRLKVIHSKTNTSSLAITMPDVYSSYDLWVNGNKIGQNGTVGVTKAEAKPQWKPETYVFTAEPDSLEIVLHISNFYHHRTGIHDPILLGQADQLVQHKNRIETTNLFLFLGLTILSIVAGVIYFRKKNIALMLYVLLCLSWMLRSAFSNHYQIVQWFPEINWYFNVRAEYISIYLTTLFGSLLVGSLFPREVNNAFRLFFIITCGCFTLFTLIAPPLLFTTYVQLYLGLSTLLLLSILVIIIKAYMESREGAGFIMISALMGVSIFGYVILSYQGVFKLNEIVFNIGFLIQFIITLIAVIRRIHKMKTTEDYDMMTFDQATRKR